MKVKVLPDILINKIAAGEVVERPASVVRELVDNALDAGANDILVQLEQGGHSLIKATDNGSGMGRDDAILAFQRHATSKISSEADLNAISSLGFRGEALPSIAAIAKVALTTRPELAAVGTRVRIEAGELLGVESLACPTGSSVEVRNIFYAMPARRKFLKQPKTEERKIATWLTHVSMGRPHVRFRLASDGREILNVGKHESLSQRARHFFKGSIVELNSDSSGLKLQGLVAHPAMAEADTQALVLLVNGRLISDRMLLKAVKEGFSGTLKDREFPVGLVSIELPPSDVDVNVHPQKSEVRFRFAGDVFVAVRNAVARAVNEFKSPLSGTWRDNLSSGESLSIGVSKDVKPAFATALASPGTSLAFDFSSNILRSPLGSEQDSQNFKFSNLHYIGQIFECYLLAESSSCLYVIDMHAAHERYNYNLIRNTLRKRDLPRQQLLVPVTLEMSEPTLQRCLERQDLLSRSGFEIEQFSPTTLLVRTMPAFLASADIDPLVKQLAQFSEEDLPSCAFEERIDKLAARLACHGSIRSGKKMTPEEVRALFMALDQSEFSAACPHGRPVVVSFTETQIEDWFGRDK